MKKRHIPKASIALIVAAFLVVTGGGAFAALAAPEIISEDYKSEFELDHIAVRLVENGIISDDIESGRLISHLGGKVDPGRVYKEELAAANTTDIDQYTRMFVYVYWTDKDGNKDTTLDPGLIELTYNDKDYNDSDWQINPDQTTKELRVFYYRKLHKAGEITEPVVNKLRLNGKVLDDLVVEEEPVKKNGKIIFKYIYKYDGYYICVEADVQSLQTHNVNDAIESAWGVTNVKVSNEVLSVN